MKKNVCMIAYTNYMTDARVRREAETLASIKGVNVSFLSLKEQNSPKIYINNGVKILELNIKKYRGKKVLNYLISYLLFLIQAFFACNRQLFNRKIDIVHIHNMPNFLVLAAILPRLLGKKLFLDIHDSMPETYSAKLGLSPKMVLFRLLCLEEAICCKFVNKIICVNHIQKNTLVKRGIASNKIQVLLNVPDHNLFPLVNVAKTEREKSKGFKLVYHGTLSKRLGVDIAIKAVAKLVGSIPGIEFYIFGNGDDINEFIELSKKLGIDENVHFNKKMVHVDKLSGMLKTMDLGIISNRKNIATDLMLPVKMLEYIALSIPVIAPSLKTIKYYFKENMLTYFEPENVDSLSLAIFELFNHDAKRLYQAKNARQFLDQFGWEKHQMELINLYTNS